MGKGLKIAAYVVCLIVAIWCTRGFSRNFSKATHDPGESVPLVTNTAPDALGTATNVTDATSAVTNETAESGMPVTQEPASAKAKGEAAKAQRQSNVWWYGAGMVLSFLGLGLLLAYDITHLFAHGVEQFIWEDQGEAYHTPEYEEAEKMWANGRHLEAIELLRDYLKEHPREQYVAIRIAEIYENDLKNYLAAALEYEEILKKPLPPEKWGWTAIHLANLYSGKLNRTADAEALLRRITGEHPYTQAAAKARERLGEAPPSPTETPPSGNEPPHNLPPGFRPKSG